MAVQVAMAGSSKSITFIWIWDPGGSSCTSGPNGDVAYDLYMRTDDDPSFAYDYSLIGGIENCWSCVANQDRYSCQTILDYEFEIGVCYYFAAIAYLVEDTTRRSIPSNQIEYYLNYAGDSGRGRCFIAKGFPNKR
jgi:hypothetical protein